MSKKIPSLMACILLVSLVVLNSCAESIPERETEPQEISVPVILQEGNNLPKTQLQSKQSKELEDNRIGCMLGPEEGDVRVWRYADEFVRDVNEVGVKWVRLSIDHFGFREFEGNEEAYSEYSIESYHDKTITGLTENGIKIMYNLNYWDESVLLGLEEKREEYRRFKTEEEIQNYLDYVRFIIHHFKDRIEYYEILNEPNGDIGQMVEAADYINLVKRTIPVIREECPEVKIVIGATCNLREPYHYEYLLDILRSDVTSLVDAVSWHPMYGASPQYDYYRQYYYDYPSIVKEIKDVASAYGFKGEYIAEELVWRTPENYLASEPWTYSEIIAAKYYARGITIQLGMNITLGTTIQAFEGMHSPERPIGRVIQNLCTIMAGANLADLSVEIQSEATNIKSYAFSLPNGDKLITLWTDGAAIDDDPGVNTVVTLPNFLVQKVMGVDVLNGFEQELVTSMEDGNLTINNLLVKDYPIILRISDQQ